MRTERHFGFVVAAAALMFGLAHAAGAQEFERFEGKDVVHEGEGGTKKVIDGVDFWSNGAPARKFKLLGYISDRRHKTGVVGMIRMAGLESSVAEEAKKAGGDAVILMESGAETVGTVSSGNTNTTGSATANGNTAFGSSQSWSNRSTAAVQKQVSKFAVIKYLHDESTPAAPATTPAAQDTTPSQ